MRPRLVLAAAFWCLLFAELTTIPAASAREPEAIPDWPICSCSAISLTGDPLVVPSEAESLLWRLIEVDAFHDAEPATRRSSITSSSVLLANPFRKSDADAGSPTCLAVQLELEQSYYGPDIDMKAEIGAFWAFGILGTAFTGNHVIGRVQWRARLLAPGLGDSFTAVGVGIVSGDDVRLDRRLALRIANRRALYKLVFEMTAGLNKRRGAPIKLKHTNEDYWDYLERVDSF